MLRNRNWCLLAAAVGWLLPTAQAQVSPRQLQRGQESAKGVKTMTDFGPCPGTTQYGEVVELYDTHLILRYTPEDGKPADDMVFYPVDVLKNGKLQKSAKGPMAYRWEDVQKGDRIDIDSLLEEEEQKVYAVQICIRGRPGAKLPQSQDPKGDSSRYQKESITNDIDNGLDVDDELIRKTFPQRKGRGDVILNPGYLYPEHRAKLDAIRAKKAKEKDLKATLPEKK